MRNDFPFFIILGNGLPVPMTAAPFVHFNKSSGTASLRLVGLESGKMTGFGVCFAMERTISSVKMSGWPDTPINKCGFAFDTTSFKLMSDADVNFQSAILFLDCTNFCW